MILILTSSDDQSTLQVIQWLNFHKLAWAKIDTNTPLTLIELLIDRETEEFIVDTPEGVRIDTREISAYWYRRGHLNLNIQVNLNDELSEVTRRQFETHMESEVRILIDSLHFCLAKKKRLNTFQTADLNKHHVLAEAKKFGLNIPPTIVTSRREALTDFKDKNGPLITKAIQHGIRFRMHGETSWVEYLTYTESFNESEAPLHFFPTLFQPQINKAFELRIFYLDGAFYSMAILSQKDEKTTVDFRKYNFEKPNRNVPYSLPHSIEEKITALMKSLQLESGSIDMIVTVDDEFIFLEVNPVGQFGMVSTPCNYHLNQKIASYLNHKA